MTIAELHLQRKTKPQRGDMRFGRSAVTNGRTPFAGEVDHRGPWTRRWKDIYEQIISELGSDVSEGQRQEARRAATLCVECEKIEGKSVAGEDIDVNQYGQLVDRVGRAFRRLGLKQSRLKQSRAGEREPGTLGRAILADIERRQKIDNERDQQRREEFEAKQRASAAPAAARPE